MPEQWDVIVIGSGFGGSVTACRLSERGMRVLVLERGRRWTPADYPRDPGDAWVFDVGRPEKHNGWIDFRILDDMTVVQGAGVGGGSLIYANVCIEPKRELFANGWPPEITFDELGPYYRKVDQMLRPATIPVGQATERYKLMQEAATKAGYGDRFRPVPVAVTFDPKWTYGQADPFNDRKSVTWVNEQGQEQGTCVHSGNCDIGCQVKAKNTLDLNYLPWAEKHGAEIRSLHLVRSISRDGAGYVVRYDRLVNGRCVRGTADARRVVVAGGSLNSTELLLRCRDQYRTLPQLSPFLGHSWSSNGDFLTPAFYSNRAVNPTQGPTITSAIDFLDGSQGPEFFIEDGGFPDLLGNLLEQLADRGSRHSRFRPVLAGIAEMLRGRNPMHTVMPWFAQGIDAANGRLYLGRSWRWLWLRKVLKLDWDIERSAPTIEAIIAMHKKLSAATGGDPWVPPTWTLLKNLITPHPLGGCNMGQTHSDGVVDHRGEVFGYPGLYVADGAIVPEAVGLNPSKTIAALAERIAAMMS